MTVAKLRIRLPSCAFPQGLEARTAAFGAGCHARPKPLVVTGDAQPRWQRPVPSCSGPGGRGRPVAATPIRIGPTVTPPLVVVLSTLYRMLAASMFGQISRLAESVSVESAR